MTKTEIVRYIINYDFSDIIDDLETLLEERRITSGAAYYVYSPYKSYPFQQICDIIGKASKSKDYFRYIKRVDSWTYNYWLKEFEADMKKARDFIEEQKNLPFEKTQRQLLVQEGEDTENY